MKQNCVREYLVPKDLEEALNMLTGFRVVPLAGATDLFCVDNTCIDAFLDITNIGLNYIKEENGKIHIGAGTTFHELIHSEIIKEKFVALHDASLVLADYTIRNVATIGGNICTALSSGDAIPPLFAVNADLVLRSSKGTRVVNINDFFEGNRQTVREPNELLIEFIVEPYGKANGRGTAYEKVGRNAVDIAIACAAAGLKVVDGVVEEAVIALGAVGPTVLRAKKVEQALVGKVIDEQTALEIAAGVAAEISPITNIRSTKEYRSDVTCELAARAILRAYQSAL